MKPFAPATSRLTTLDQLDRNRICRSERRMAKAYLRQSDLLADLLVWVDVELRRVRGLVGHGIGALARRSKVRAATSEPN